MATVKCLCLLSEMPQFSLHLEDKIAVISQIKLPMAFHVKCHFSMGSDLWKNYPYSSINYLDKNVIKLFLMSCCKGGVSNSHRLPELAFVWFSLFCAWELQSLCERSPPAEQCKKCHTQVALPVPCAEEQPCCVQNSSDQSPHEHRRFWDSLNPDCLHWSWCTMNVGLQGQQV